MYFGHDNNDCKGTVFFSCFCMPCKSMQCITCKILSLFSVVFLLLVTRCICSSVFFYLPAFLRGDSALFCQEISPLFPFVVIICLSGSNRTTNIEVLSKVRINFTTRWSTNWKLVLKAYFIYTWQRAKK